MAEARKTYENKKQHKEALMSELPDFARSYIKHFEIAHQERSVYAYIYDLTTFFKYLIASNPIYKNYSMNQFLASDMEKLTPADFDEFLADLVEGDNQKITVKRKMAALHGMFAYMVSREMIMYDPSAVVKVEYREKEKEITFLTAEETERFLNYIKNREIPDTEKRKKQYESERVRDYAIASLFLGTGMRVSELVGINLDDIDYTMNKINLWRKGGSQKHVYYNEKVAEALYDYLEEREEMTPVLKENDKKEDMKALFLSSHMRRITTRTVENIICRYAEATVPYKHITPHKLRSSFATRVLHETQNIAIVSTALNHKSITTTQKYYSKVLDEDLKKAAEHAL